MNNGSIFNQAVRCGGAKPLEGDKAIIAKLENEILILQQEAIKKNWNFADKRKSNETSVNNVTSTSAPPFEPSPPSIYSIDDVEMINVIEASEPQRGARAIPNSKKSSPWARNGTRTMSPKTMAPPVAKLLRTDSPKAISRAPPAATSTTFVQTDESFSVPPPLPQSTIAPPQRICRDELDWCSQSVTTREKIFEKMDKIVDLEFQLMQPCLKYVTQIAPRNIMKKQIKRCEIKYAFPSVVDIMFQWGLEEKRRKERIETGIKEPLPPILPSKFGTGPQYFDIKNAISIRFKYGGTWGALGEVRDWLQKLFKSMEGQARFRLYEFNTLMNFWRLIFWANQLWRGVLIEEEETELVLKNRQQWVKELRGWTGLVLKCDWRDYFSETLEIELRKLTLGILESIVLSGYFEQTANRYEILYRIMKDVLGHEWFRSTLNVQRIVRITTWSISDLCIVRYLCFKRNEANTCLARMIGESVLKSCQEASNNPTDIARLFIDLAFLLETLMRDKVTPYHQSKYARQELGEDDVSKKAITPQPSNPKPELSNLRTEDMEVDDSVPSSQFACPVKYNVTPSVEVPAVDDTDLLKSCLSCWLDPTKYEDPYGRDKLCQCRKALMGSAITVLRMVFDAWLARHLEYTRNLETRLIREQEELDRLEYIKSSLSGRETPPISCQEDSDASMSKEKGGTDRLNFLRTKKAYIEGMMEDMENFMNEKLTYHRQEWNLNDCIQSKKLLPSTDSLPSYIVEMQKIPDVFDLALAKGLLIMDFLRTRSDNLAAALGTDAYKTFLRLIPALKLYMFQINLTKNDRELIMGMSTECEEEHVGSASVSFALSQEQKAAMNYQPASVTNPHVAYPIPLSQLVESDPVGWDATKIKGQDAVKQPRSQPMAEEESEFLADGFLGHEDFLDDEFIPLPNR
ncbi:uncharacterized protein LOC110853174 isoform X2 [Folsomia candida]|uniref:uncharacterized protein LOC110853174 isoform X2 n=1 Tax=Folsomia candida TaxID=158441 RepID=UPI001604DA7C|nr:uncharacterized protein LOC110853174 isoform X2 [Folsomia candida]